MLQERARRDVICPRVERGLPESRETDRQASVDIHRAESAASHDRRRKDPPNADDERRQ